MGSVAQLYPQAAPPVALNSPLQTIGGLMQLRSQINEAALRGAQVEQAKQQTAMLQAEQEQKNRDLRSNDKLQEVLADPSNHEAIGHGDFSSIWKAGVSPTVAIPAITNLQTAREKAQSLDTAKADFYAKGREQLKDTIAGLDSTKDDAAAADQWNKAIPVLAQTHPELAQSLPTLGPSTDFRQKLEDIAKSNSVYMAILKDRAAQGKVAAETAASQATAAKATADAAKAKAELPGAVADSKTKEAESVIKQAQASAMKAMASGDPAEIDKTVDAIIPPGDPMNASGKTLLHTLVQHGASMETINGAVKDMYDQRGRVQVAKESAQNKLSIDMGSVIGTQGQPSALAKQVANYQVPFTSAAARLPPAAREQLSQQIQEINPNFQASNFQTYQSTEKDATTGKIATAANALNTMMGHLTILNQAADALKNGDVQLINKLANSLGAQVGQTPKTTYETIVHRVGPEVTKAYLASGGSVGERGTNEADFSSSLSPDQIKSNIAISAELANSKIKALQDQYKRGTYGRGQQKLITDEAEAARNSLASGSHVGTGIKATHTLNNRGIGVDPKTNKWVYVDTGDPVK